MCKCLCHTFKWRVQALQANILVTSSGRACLADFGIAIVRDSHGQMTTTMFNGGGTVNFMAPELLRPEPDFDVKNLDKCDMYAFGCVCYEVRSTNCLS